ncbi:MAG: hypothetical protein V3S55_07680 [Nitrospiraceae bacterium]
MTYQCIVKGNASEAIQGAAKFVPKGTHIVIDKVNREDVILRVEGTAASLERSLYDWFAADGPSMPPKGFPAGSLLWHSTS